MSSISIAGDTSGSVILTVPAAAGSGTVTLPSGTGTAAVQGVSTNVVNMATQATTSGTVVNFTGIPSYVRRITVNVQGLQISATANILIQLGTSSGFVTTGYSGTSLYNGASGPGNFTTGFQFIDGSSANQVLLMFTLNLVDPTNNVWLGSGLVGGAAQNFLGYCIGRVTLSGPVTQLRLYTTTGTDTFTAGSMNVFYE